MYYKENINSYRKYSYYIIYNIINWLKEIVGSPLFAITFLHNIDGNLLLMSTSGAIGTPATALVYGLTSIAGVGAYSIGVNERQAGRLSGKVLAGIAVISTFATILIVIIGSRLPLIINTTVLKIFGGAAVLLIAYMIWGKKLPSICGLPLPSILVGMGIIMGALL